MAKFLKLISLFGVVVFATSAKADIFDIQVDLTGVAAEYQQAFIDAEAVWESRILDYQNGVVTARTGGSSYNVGDTISTLFIDADIVPIDGQFGILGSAGPTEIIQDQLNFVMATDGQMEFDSADVPALVTNGTFGDVILHEMGHVMGFGTLWTNNNVYTNGSGEFTGANATAFWQSEFGQAGTPDVELGGGGGTANGHWNENNGGGSDTGITDSMGRDMRNELMTGWLDSNNPSFISDMTLGSFQDIGFGNVVYSVPEPASVTFLMLGAGALMMRRRRIA